MTYPSKHPYVISERILVGLAFCCILGLFLDLGLFLNSVIAQCDKKLQSMCKFFFKFLFSKLKIDCTNVAFKFMYQTYPKFILCTFAINILFETCNCARLRNRHSFYPVFFICFLLLKDLPTKSNARLALFLAAAIHNMPVSTPVMRWRTDELND